MTAEIAVMNKNGIALAADSAVTITGVRNPKIYQTHKLFMLSKYHPVGVMIYGNPEILGVPWQIIIKEFRKKELKKESCATLQDYAGKFIRHLNNNHKYFPPDKQRLFLKDVASSEFEDIDKRINNDVQQISEKENGRKATPEEATSIIEKHILQTLQELLELENITTLPNYSYRKILKRYKDTINASIQHYFPFIVITSYLAKWLRRIVVLTFVKNTFDEEDNYSGIVIAGFGDEEVFGSVIEYNIDAVINDNVKYIMRQHTVANQEGASAILPFAQREMVYSFVKGISPTYQMTIAGFLENLFTIYPKEIIKQISGLDNKEKNALLKKMTNATQGLIQQFLTQIEQWTEVNNVSPILTTVAFLPLEELASMAESLVNLTSFKRRVTMGDAETVGGPIDVAVISKGDGFIWINRKHYFEAKYNPHFSANYYRE